MSRNGSGGYNLPTNSWNPAVNGVSATAADWQNLINDIATAIQQSVSADGQTPITGNINMNNNKFTGLAAGNATGNSLRWEQLFSQGVEQDLASAATTDIGLQNTSFLRITGTTTITSFGTNYNGPRFIRFAGALTLTNSAALEMPYGVNITTTAGDCLIVVPKATSGTADGWRVVAYQYANALLERQSLGIPFVGNRNKVINGNFQYSQRFGGVSQTITAGAALKYIADRFFVYSTLQDATAVTAPIILGKFTVNSSILPNSVTVGTRIPQRFTHDLTNCTLSVKISTTDTSAVNWFVYEANTADSFGTVAAPTKTLKASGNFITTTSLAQYSANFNASNINGLEILFTMAGSSATFSNVQLEQGTISNSNIVFDWVDPVTELAKCNHYYRTVKASARGPASATGQVFDNGVNWNQMRATPTVALVTAGTTSANATNNGIVVPSDIGGRFSIVSTSAGDCFSVDNVYSLDAEMYT